MDYGERRCYLHLRWHLNWTVHLAVQVSSHFSMPFVAENRFRRVLQKRMGSGHRECIFSTRRNFSFDRHMCTCVLCTCAHCFLCSLGTSEAGQMEYKMCSDKLQSLFERWWAMCCVLCAMCTLWKDCNTHSFGRAVSLLRDETTVDQLAPSFGSLTSDNRVLFHRFKLHLQNV